MEKSDFYREIAANKRRTFVLMFVFALVVIVLGYALGAVWGDPYLGLVLAFAVSLLMAWGSYYYSDQVVLAITHARPATKEEFPQFVNAVEGLAIAAGLPAPRCYVMDEPAPNAFATGRDPEHAIICATTGLLSTLGRYEVEGVVAHEMSHILNYDVRLQTIAVVLAGMVVLLGDWLLRSLFWGRRSNRRSSRNDNAAAGVILAIGLIFAVLSPIIAQLMKMAISRRREYLADATAVRLTRYPQGLADALAALSSANTPMHDANRATAHLFIVSPLKGKGLDSLFSTHPPIEERISRLRSMDVSTMVGPEGSGGR